MHAALKEQIAGLERRLWLEGSEAFDKIMAPEGSVAKIVKLEHAWRRLDGRNDDGFQVAPFPG